MSICPCQITPPSEASSKNPSQSSTEKRYSDCCEVVHKNSLAATTAERLMRARYCAFVFKLHDFLLATLDPSTRNEFDHEANREWAEKAEFLGLTIEKTRALGARGQVQFHTIYKIGQDTHKHRELSFFERKNGQWYFSKGKSL